MLEIKNVSKSYGNKKALDNVSLKIKKGKIFGFIGENGAGKTTLIKAIVGIHDFDSGDILIDGVSIKLTLSNAFLFPVLCKKKMAYVPDNPDIYPNLRGIDYLNFICDIYEINEEERNTLIKKYADKFLLTSSLGDIISSYSHGMKQKLVIISALIHKPSLIILDEPFVGLDPKSTKDVKDIMKELCKENVTFFFSSHVLEVVEKLCDEVAIIKDGKILEVGSVDKIKGNKDLTDAFLEKTYEK